MFRALVKRKKTTPLLLEKFLSINQTNSISSTSINEAFSLPVEISGNRDFLVILRIIEETLGNLNFVISIVQDIPLIWNDNYILSSSGQSEGYQNIVLLYRVPQF